jgi:hypothetical protein
MLRLMLDFLTAEYALTPEIRDLLASVSPRTIDRILKPVKDRGRLRGLSLTKPGTLLRDQIPVRALFNWDERKPGTSFPSPSGALTATMAASSSITKSKTGAT